MKKIESKIVGYSVDNSKPQKEFNESTPRPSMLSGLTYKIKPPLEEHAMYITINNIEMDGRVRPYEIFINSKNMDNFQWVVALTRVLSATFRKGGKVSFLADELISVFSPSGGYFRPGGKFIPSVVAEIGMVLQEHLSKIDTVGVKESNDKDLGGEVYPDNATLCTSCMTKALVILDGCPTCLSCGYSKCS